MSSFKNDNLIFKLILYFVWTITALNIIIEFNLFRFVLILWGTCLSVLNILGHPMGLWISCLNSHDYHVCIYGYSNCCF